MPNENIFYLLKIFFEQIFCLSKLVHFNTLKLWILPICFVVVVVVLTVVVLIVVVL